MADDLSNYLRPKGRHTATLAAVALLLTALAVWLGTQAYAAYGRTVVLKQRAAVLRATSQRPPAPPPSRADLDTQKRWAALRAERAFSWTPVLAAVERAGDENIERLGFQPDKAARQVILRGEGRDKLAVVEFLERLSAQPALSGVHLTHQKNTARGTLVTVAFEIKATIAM
jgi:hypothetical protein